MITIFHECDGGLNLDGESETDLFSFAASGLAHFGPDAPKVFAGLAPSTRVLAIRLCREYARQKYHAMRLRENGRIGLAIDREELAQRIYNRLPVKARW